MIRLRAGSATDVGLVRTNNQDRLLVANRLFAVADGMGGAAAGEVASATAVQRLVDAFDAAGEPTPETLLAAARSANSAVWEQAEANPEMRGMGTTLVALALVDEDRLAAINIGDSRLYLLRDEEFRQVTSDHNLVAELVAEGRISKEEAEVHPRRNIMTRALGVDPEVDVDLFIEDVRAGDRYLLCSDGLPRELRDEHIASLLRRLADPQEAARELVDEAKRRGGNDNITAVVVDIVDDDPTVAGSTVMGSTVMGSTVMGSTVTGSTVTGPTVVGAIVSDDQVGPNVVESAPSPTRDADASARAEAPKQASAETPKPPKAKMITFRVVGFFVLLLVILGLAAAAITWYSRSSYFVGLLGDRVTIFQGRPGGVLWFHPTISARTNVTTDGVLPHEIPKLRAGQQEASVSDARSYVASLVAEANAARAAQAQAAANAAQAAQSTTTVPATTGSPPTT